MFFPLWQRRDAGPSHSRLRRIFKKSPATCDGALAVAGDLFVRVQNSFTCTGEPWRGGGGAQGADRGMRVMHRLYLTVDKHTPTAAARHSSSPRSEPRGGDSGKSPRVTKWPPLCQTAPPTAHQPRITRPSRRHPLLIARSGLV